MCELHILGKPICMHVRWVLKLQPGKPEVRTLWPGMSSGPIVVRLAL